MKTTFISGLVFFVFFISCQQEQKVLSSEEIASLNKALKEDTLFAQVLNSYGDPVKIYEDYKLRVRKSDSIWTEDQNILKVLNNVGTTERFEILPLIDWYTKNDSLTGEAGVSYLIRTDEATILFDVGLNDKNSHPSPLLNNMEKLGVSLDEIDIVVISHNHRDHVGGDQWTTEKTFSLTNHQIDLGQKRIYTPEIMTYPDQEPVYTPNPVKIAEGVATIGVIDCPMFFTETREQAIAVNVKDIGVVIISGCGHQTIEKIVLRSELLFDEPIYALIGGFHLPVNIGRNIGKYYRYIVTGKLPWDHLTVENVENKIAFLKEHGIKVFGISAHDSCDDAINAFKKAFGKDYLDIVVGQKIILNN